MGRLVFLYQTCFWCYPSLKMNGWKTFSFPFGMAYFQVRTVSFRECKSTDPNFFVRFVRLSMRHFRSDRNLTLLIEVAKTHPLSTGQSKSPYAVIMQP